MGLFPLGLGPRAYMGLGISVPYSYKGMLIFNKLYPKMILFYVVSSHCYYVCFFCIDDYIKIYSDKMRDRGIP